MDVEEWSIAEMTRPKGIDIPVNEEMELKGAMVEEELSNSNCAASDELKEPSENPLRNDIQSEVRNDSVECSLLGNERDSCKQKQKTVNEDIPEAGPTKKGRLRRRPLEAYCCDICEKSFKTNWDVQSHVVTHYDERPYICDKCKKGFKVFNQLRCHQRLHKKHELEAKSGQNKKIFSCTSCEKSYSNKSSLYNHFRTHTSKYACNVCQKGFHCQSFFERHVLTHTKERPFLCGVCGKSFNQKSNLQQHVETHSDVRSFICSICSRTFKTKASLNHHKLIHLK